MQSLGHSKKGVLIQDESDFGDGVQASLEADSAPIAPTPSAGRTPADTSPAEAAPRLVAVGAGA